MRWGWTFGMAAAALGVAGSAPSPAQAPVAPQPAAGECAPSDGMTFLCGIHHPEDIDAVPGGRWVIATESSFGGGRVGAGAIVLIDTRTLAVSRIRDVPSGLRPEKPYQDCPAPPRFLSPHGLALRPGASGRHLLYVVNHQREAIEIFRVRAGGGAPALRWIGCVMIPLPAYLNAVAPMPDGGFVTTKMGDADGEALYARMGAGLVTGAVYRWRPGQGAPTIIPNSQASANNGIAADRRGTIFVSSWGTHAVVRLRPVAGGYRRDEVAVGFVTDNMRWAPDGGLLVTGQHIDASGAPPPPCRPAACVIGWSTVRVDPETLTVTPIFDHDGHAFAGATTALPVGRDLWLGSYVGDKMAVIRGGYAKAAGR